MKPNAELNSGIPMNERYARPRDLPLQNITTGLKLEETVLRVKMTQTLLMWKCLAKQRTVWISENGVEEFGGVWEEKDDPN